VIYWRRYVLNQIHTVKHVDRGNLCKRRGFEQFNVCVLNRSEKIEWTQRRENDSVITLRQSELSSYLLRLACPRTE
jgi:hypothetical protein